MRLSHIGGWVVLNIIYYHTREQEVLQIECPTCGASLTTVLPSNEDRGFARLWADLYERPERGFSHLAGCPDCHVSLLIITASGETYVVSLDTSLAVEVAVKACDCESTVKETR
jgi:hypothetical protein